MYCSLGLHLGVALHHALKSIDDGTEPLSHAYANKYINVTNQWVLYCTVNMLAAVHHLSLSWQAEHEGNDIHIRHVCAVAHCIIYKEHVHMGKQQLSYMYGNYRFLHTHAAHTAAPNTAAAHYSSSLACPCIALTATPHYSVWEKAVGFCPQLSVTSCRSLLYPAPKARCMLFSRPGSGLVPRSNTFYLSSLMLRYTRTI